MIGTMKALLGQAERTGAIVLQPVRHWHRVLAAAGVNPITNITPRREGTWTRRSQRRRKRTTKPVCARTLRERPRDRTVQPALIDMRS